MQKFSDYIAKRFSPEKIADMERKIALEIEAMETLQKNVAESLKQYMEREDIGFNELVDRMGVSPSQANKIRKGTANLTMASIAHLAALFGSKPQLTFQ